MYPQYGIFYYHASQIRYDSQQLQMLYMLYAIRILKLNARKNKLMVEGDENANVSIDVDGETIDKVNSFKYLGAIKTSMGSCSEDIKARLGRAKKATMELDIIRKDRGIWKEIKMKLVKALIWPVITYGAEGWKTMKDD